MIACEENHSVGWRSGLNNLAISFVSPISDERTILDPYLQFSHDEWRSKVIFTHLLFESTTK
jgi:hypothetical protein